MGGGWDTIELCHNESNARFVGSFDSENKESKMGNPQTEGPRFNLRKGWSRRPEPQKGMIKTKHRIRIF